MDNGRSFFVLLLVGLMVVTQRSSAILTGENFDSEDDSSILDRITKLNTLVGQDFYEGDIVLTHKENVVVDESNTGDIDGKIFYDGVKRNAMRNREDLWNNKIIPYVIESKLLSVTAVIQSAFKEFHKSTCLKFVPRTTENKWIQFVKGKGCWSFVGRRGRNGAQNVSIGSGCQYKGIIMHELLHALGFWHEQSRPDRNLYVEILWENIEAGKEHNFNKYSHGLIDTLKASYDFRSIMHYGKYSFSKNRKPTIQSIMDPNQYLGQRNGFSQTDIFEINALYDCSGPSNGWSSWSDYGPCNSKCKKIRQRFCSSSGVLNCPKANSKGLQEEVLLCPSQECKAPVDGHWGRWSEWSRCSTPCGNGIHNRTRKCSDPPPQNGGKPCQGDNIMFRVCKLKLCNDDDCEFEVNYCHWRQNPRNRYKWYRRQGKTSSVDTGPDGDITEDLNGKGSYIYAEATGVRRRNKTELESKLFPATSGRCMKFFYNMYGSDVGSLNVYVVNAKTKVKKAIFTKSGNQGQRWYKAEETITSPSDYKVLFEVIRGDSYKSDVALDDIMFKDKKCQGLQTARPTTAQSTSPSLVSTSMATPTSLVSTTTKASTYPPTTVWPTTRSTTARTSKTQVPTTTHPPTTVWPTTRSTTARTSKTQVPTTTHPPTTVWPTTRSTTARTSAPRPSTTMLPSKTQPTTTNKRKPSSKPTTVPLSTTRPSTVGTTSAHPSTSKTSTLASTGLPTTGQGDNCNFDQDLCHWKNGGGTSRYPWTRLNRSTPSYGTGPANDHTTGSGYYVYVEASNMLGSNQTATLLSKVFPPFCIRCMKFYYHMYGSYMGHLNVYIWKLDINTKYRIFDKSGNQGNQWHSASVSFRSSYRYKVIFESVRGSSYTSDIAIDDISFSDGPCPTKSPHFTTPPYSTRPATPPSTPRTTMAKPSTSGRTTALPTTQIRREECNFDQDMCYWTRGAGTSKYPWVRISGATPSSKTGPIKDHTSGSGYYVYVETSSPAKKGQTATLVSKVFPAAPVGRCMSFFYHMFGNAMGALNVYIKHLYNNVKVIVFTKSGNQGNQWNSANVSFGTGYKYKVILESVRGSSYTSDIAIDDISFSDGPCPTKIRREECNFDQDMCYWTKGAGTSKYPWVRISGATPSSKTGPIKDHTSGSGYYVYVETSSPAKKGQTATLVSKVFPAAPVGRCMSFFYHMFGNAMGALNVYIKQLYTNVKVIVFTKYGNQGNQWNSANVSFSTGYNYKVILESVRGSSYTSDIAVDDISFTEHPCPIETNRDDCNFDQDMCYWTKGAGTSKYPWVRISGATPSSKTGPIKDHTSGSGYYVYVETSSPAKKGQTATLVSKVFPAAPVGRCMSFFYHMFGNAMGALNVYIKQLYTNVKVIVFTKSGNQGDQWNSANVTLRSTFAYKIILQSVRGSSYSSDIAIDDISFKDAPCPIIPATTTISQLISTTTPPPTPTTPEKIDRCDFDRDYCFWSDGGGTNYFSWSRRTGSTQSWNTGPSKDHTTGSGYYVYVETSSPAKKGQTATLVSKVFPAAPVGRCMSFFYHMFGNAMGTLNVYVARLYPNNMRTKVFTETGNKGNKWINSKTTIKSNYDYQIIFESVRGSSYTSDMALDDITIKNGVCRSSVKARALNNRDVNIYPNRYA